jgi:hypothetical protein
VFHEVWVLEQVVGLPSDLQDVMGNSSPAGFPTSQHRPWRTVNEDGSHVLTIC